MKKNIYSTMLITIILFALGCGSTTNTDNSAESFSVDISGFMNGESVSIDVGFCETSELTGSFELIIGRNRAFPVGLLLLFDSLDVIETKEYTLPSDVLIAGYSPDMTAASGGTVTIESLVKTETTIQSVSGSANLIFTEEGVPENTIGEISGTFNCVFDL